MTPDGSTISETYLNDNDRGNKEVKQTHSTHTKQVTSYTQKCAWSPGPSETTGTHTYKWCRRCLIQTHCPSGMLTWSQTLMFKLFACGLHHPSLLLGFFMFVCIGFFLTKKDENFPELPYDIEKTQHYNVSMSRIRLSDSLKPHNLQSWWGRNGVGSELVSGQFHAAGF